jgi:hypothetical protein
MGRRARTRRSHKEPETSELAGRAVVPLRSRSSAMVGQCPMPHPAVVSFRFQSRIPPKRSSCAGLFIHYLFIYYPFIYSNFLLKKETHTSCLTV